MGGAGGEREADAWQACSAECTAIPARSFTRQSRHNCQRCKGRRHLLLKHQEGDKHQESVLDGDIEKDNGSKAAESCAIPYAPTNAGLPAVRCARIFCLGSNRPQHQPQHTRCNERQHTEPSNQDLPAEPKPEAQARNSGKREFPRIAAGIVGSERNTLAGSCKRTADEGRTQ
mgnify:CR=1 FL=1